MKHLPIVKRPVMPLIKHGMIELTICINISIILQHRMMVCIVKTIHIVKLQHRMCILYQLHQVLRSHVLLFRVVIDTSLLHFLFFLRLLLQLLLHVLLFLLLVYVVELVVGGFEITDGLLLLLLVLHEHLLVHHHVLLVYRLIGRWM